MELDKDKWVWKYIEELFRKQKQNDRHARKRLSSLNEREYYWKWGKNNFQAHICQMLSNSEDRHHLVRVSKGKSMYRGWEDGSVNEVL